MTDLSEPASAGTPPACLPARLQRPRLRRVEAAEYLELAHGVRYAPSTLAKLFTIGGGPSVEHCGRVPLYSLAALDAWVASKLGAPVASSSEKKGLG